MGAKVSSKNKNFTRGEYVRVVPLHYPKPDVLRAAIPSAELTYRNGPLITNVELFTVFWGKLWGSTPSSTDLMQRLNAFFTDILVTSVIDQLAEYDVPGQAVPDRSSVRQSSAIMLRWKVSLIRQSAGTRSLD
jgi:hypothetical protein